MNPHAEHAQALAVAALARRTLAGQHRAGGYWQMPAGAGIVRLCWRQNLDRARRLRLALHPARRLP